MTRLLVFLLRLFSDKEPTPGQLLRARKIAYIVLILVLFTGSFLWRQVFVDPARQQGGLSEQSHGDVRLTGSIVRLSLGGFRGVTTCYLWNLAIDKQMKNQLNELEVIVGWLTELQPHFNTPWLFQSWNLAYNVSNKTDRISDKYFYITRGIRLLADGERQNHDNPDLRFELATTYQHKICQSDETNYHRSLFQLSLIPPNERDPARFRPKPGVRQKVNMEEFVKFSKAHPQLIRRLREAIHKEVLYEQRRLFACPTPAAVVQFLADNYRVPSLYPEAKPTPADAEWVENLNVKPDKDVLERFPALPPHREFAAPSQHFYEPYDGCRERDEESPYGEDVDSWDGFTAARAWYSYSQEPIPPPGALPGDTQPITDPIHQRNPGHMQTIIFRHYPARAQSYVAERLEEEGWFDHEGWSPRGTEWFPDVIGKSCNAAVDAWPEAFKMWQAHGERNHLLLTPEKEQALREKAARYRQDRGLTAGTMVPQTDDASDPQLRDEFQAATYLFNYDANRTIGNFPANYGKALVEQDKKTVRAHKLFYQAQALASTGSTFLALRMYEEPDPDPDPVLLYGPENQQVRLSALDAWAEVLREHPDYRNTDAVGEATYEIQLDYLDVLNRALPSNELKAQLGAASAIGADAWFNLAALAEVRRPDLMPPLTVTNGPFDRLDEKGAPWIRAALVKSVLDRRRQYQPPKKDAGETPAPQPPPAKPTETPAPGKT